MVELADTQDLGSCASQRAGSTPVTRTKAPKAVYAASGAYFVKLINVKMHPIYFHRVHKFIF